MSEFFHWVGYSFLAKIFVLGSIAFPIIAIVGYSKGLETKKKEGRTDSRQSDDDRLNS